MDVPSANIEYFTGIKKYAPPCYDQLPSVDEEVNLKQQNNSRKIDDIFYLCKSFAKNLVPGWTGFNTLCNLYSHPLSKTKIGYLPILDANPTEMSTVNTILCRSLQIANELQIDNVVLVMDQAIYSKAQQIKWQNEDFQKRLVTRLGEFHTIMAFLSVIGKRFRDAGLQDIFIESGVVAQNSVNQVVTGHHYNRSLRAHKLVCEALQRIRFKIFLDEENVIDSKIVESAIEEFCNGFSLEHFEMLLCNDQVKNLLLHYKEFIIFKSRNNPTFELWSSYIEMVQLLLTFIRATREGNWELHLSAIKSMLPWFFAYDRINYSRYVSVYWCEMINLNITHPDIYREFKKGRFSVQQQEFNSFSQTPCDQVIEQTCNRDTKTKGGLTGFSCNKGAVHRWILSHHSRAAISLECEYMAGKKIDYRRKKELDFTRMKQDESLVLTICDTINSMSNPFKAGIDANFLLNIVTGSVAPENVKTDMKHAYEIGNKAATLFLKDRLQKNKSDFFSPIKCLKLKTFSDVGKTVQVQLKQETVALKTDRYLLRRILMISKVQDINLQDLMRYSLSPVPLSLANYDGTKTRTNKATLLHHIEKCCETATTDLQAIPSESALIIDAMAVIQQLQNTSVTFGDLAMQIFKTILKLAKDFKCTRADFVSDQYPDLSIKSAERDKRSTAGVQIIKISHAAQKLPKQMKKFLASGKNKEELIAFCFQSWKKLPPELFDDIILYITYKSTCHKLQNLSGILVDENVATLNCDHEEADTRMFLHAAHASQSYKNIIIKSPDTDVLVLAISLIENINAHLFISYGTLKSMKIYDINVIYQTLGSDVSKALIGVHVYTGCDSVSSFKGKSKVKAYKAMTDSKEYIAAFQALGMSWEISNNLISQLESFTCLIYGQNKCSDIDNCRYIYLRLGYKNDDMLPPNRDALMKHILRANYQTSVLRKSLLCEIKKPCPSAHGWKVFNNCLKIDWMSLKPVPDSILYQVHCKCKKTLCASALCSCNRLKIQCTELCCCENCQNCSGPEVDTISESEEDILFV